MRSFVCGLEQRFLVLVGGRRRSLGFLRQPDNRERFGAHGDVRQRIALAAHLPVSYTEIENYKNNVKHKIETAKLKSPYNRIRRSTKI